MTEPMTDPVDLFNFWRRVNTQGECWIWTGGKFPTGYGGARINGGAVQLAHRVSYMYFNGPIEDGMQIDHICRERACVNPQHLRQVTPKQNQENQPGRRPGFGVRGLSWQAGTQKWLVRVKHNGKQYSFGTYADKEEAERVAIAARLELFTHNDADRKSA